ncbi:MAG: hypothetical protein ACJATV_001645 [Granulosicoccus sp.]|jgi:hypothetical protein
MPEVNTRSECQWPIVKAAIALSFSKRGFMEQLLKFTLPYNRDRLTYLRGYKWVRNVVVLQNSIWDEFCSARHITFHNTR